MFDLLGAFAEFEQSIIRERQAEGIALAKAAGRYVGRVRKLTDARLGSAREQISAGVRRHGSRAS